MTVTETLNKILELKTQIKANPQNSEVKKILAETKSEMDKIISEQPRENVIAEFESWLAIHPDEKHAAQKLQKLKEI